MASAFWPWWLVSIKIWRFRVSRLATLKKLYSAMVFHVWFSLITHTQLFVLKARSKSQNMP